MKVFLAGIMQGSIQGDSMHDQGYRGEISTLVRGCFPDAEIVDPWALHPDSPAYADDPARQTFFESCQQAGQADLLIAYLPEASIGTAIEMWEACPPQRSRDHDLADGNLGDPLSFLAGLPVHGRVCGYIETGKVRSMQRGRMLRPARAAICTFAS